MTIFSTALMFTYDDEMRIVDANGVVFDNQQRKFKTETKAFTLATINEIDDANMRAVWLNRHLWGLVKELDDHFGRTPEPQQQVPQRVLDELAMLKSGQSPPKKGARSR